MAEFKVGDRVANIHFNQQGTVLAVYKDKVWVEMDYVVTSGIPEIGTYEEFNLKLAPKTRKYKVYVCQLEANEWGKSNSIEIELPEHVESIPMGSNGQYLKLPE